MPTLIEHLPVVKEFKGMNFEPKTMQITVSYLPEGRSDALCQMEFSIESSGSLAAWLVEMYDTLTSSHELGQRLQALKFRNDKPQGHA